MRIGNLTTIPKRVMKATLRCARIGGSINANHNDRTFDARHAYHIDETRSHLNRQVIFIDGQIGGVCKGINQFAIHEYQYYGERYGDSVAAQKERHIRSRHKQKAEDCTVNRVYENKQTCPKCFVTQIGKDGEYSNIDMLWKMNLKYCEWLNSLASDTARIVVLDTAMHCDETTPHCHTNVVFEVKDKEGNWIPSQEECLKRLGYKKRNKLKDKDIAKKKNLPRHENACIDFTDCAQQKWYDIIEEMDLTISIDRVPTSKPHQKTDHEASKAKQNLENIKSQTYAALIPLQESERMKLEAMEKFLKKKDLEQEFENFYNGIFDQYYDWGDEFDR